MVDLCSDYTDRWPEITRSAPFSPPPPHLGLFFFPLRSTRWCATFFFFFVIFIGFVEIHTPFCLLPLCHTSLLSISIWLNRRLGRERWGRVIGSVGGVELVISHQQRSRGSRWVKYYTTNLATDKEDASYVSINPAFQSNVQWSSTSVGGETRLALY